jgi:hypothetical protein
MGKVRLVLGEQAPEESRPVPPPHRFGTEGAERVAERLLFCYPQPIFNFHKSAKLIFTKAPN